MSSADANAPSSTTIKQPCASSANVATLRGTAPAQGLPKSVAGPATAAINLPNATSTSRQLATHSPLPNADAARPSRISATLASANLLAVAAHAGEVPAGYKAAQNSSGTPLSDQQTTAMHAVHSGEAAAHNGNGTPGRSGSKPPAALTSEARKSPAGAAPHAGQPSNGGQPFQAASAAEAHVSQADAGPRAGQLSDEVLPSPAVREPANGSSSKADSKPHAPHAEHPGMSHVKQAGTLDGMHWANATLQNAFPSKRQKLSDASQAGPAPSKTVRARKTLKKGVPHRPVDGNVTVSPKPDRAPNLAPPAGRSPADGEAFASSALHGHAKPRVTEPIGKYPAADAGNAFSDVAGVPQKPTSADGSSLPEQHSPYRFVRREPGNEGQQSLCPHQHQQETLQPSLDAGEQQGQQAPASLGAAWEDIGRLASQLLPPSMLSEHGDSRASLAHPSQVRASQQSQQAPSLPQGSLHSSPQGHQAIMSVLPGDLSATQEECSSAAFALRGAEPVVQHLDVVPTYRSSRSQGMEDDHGSVEQMLSDPVEPEPPLSNPASMSVPAADPPPDGSQQQQGSNGKKRLDIATMPAFDVDPAAEAWQQHQGSHGKKRLNSASISAADVDPAADTSHLQEGISGRKRPLPAQEPSASGDKRAKNGQGHGHGSKQSSADIWNVPPNKHDGEACHPAAQATSCSSQRPVKPSSKAARRKRRSPDTRQPEVIDLVDLIDLTDEP